MRAISKSWTIRSGLGLTVLVLSGLVLWLNLESGKGSSAIAKSGEKAEIPIESGTISTPSKVKAEHGVRNSLGLIEEDPARDPLHPHVPVYTMGPGGVENRFLGEGSLEATFIGDDMRLKRSTDRILEGEWLPSFPDRAFLGPLAQELIMGALLDGEPYMRYRSEPISLAVPVDRILLAPAPVAVLSVVDAVSGKPLDEFQAVWESRVNAYGNRLIYEQHLEQLRQDRRQEGLFPGGSAVESAIRKRAVPPPGLVDQGLETYCSPMGFPLQSYASGILWITALGYEWKQWEPESARDCGPDQAMIVELQRSGVLTVCVKGVRAGLDTRLKVIALGGEHKVIRAAVERDGCQEFSLPNGEYGVELRVGLEPGDSVVDRKKVVLKHNNNTSCLLDVREGGGPEETSVRAEVICDLGISSSLLLGGISLRPLGDRTLRKKKVIMPSVEGEAWTSDLDPGQTVVVWESHGLEPGHYLLRVEGVGMERELYLSTQPEFVVIDLEQTTFRRLRFVQGSSLDEVPGIFGVSIAQFPESGSGPPSQNIPVEVEAKTPGVYRFLGPPGEYCATMVSLEFGLIPNRFQVLDSIVEYDIQVPDTKELKFLISGDALDSEADGLDVVFTDPEGHQMELGTARSWSFDGGKRYFSIRLPNEVEECRAHLEDGWIFQDSALADQLIRLDEERVLTVGLDVRRR